MASPAERTRNNVRMGIFVSVAILLALGIVVALSDVWTKLTRQTDDWTVRFTTRSGVAHIKPGSEVRVGGLAMGDVSGVMPIYGDGPDRVLSHVDVQFRLDRNVRLYRDALILASSQLIGAEGWIDIPHVGTSAAGEAIGETIRGTEALGMLTALLGAEGAARAGDLVEFLGMIPDEYRQRIVPVLDDVKDTTGRVRETFAGFTDDTWPRWKAHVDASLANVEQATTKADAILDDAAIVAADVRDTIAENRPHILAATKNAEVITEDVRHVSQEVREEIMAKVHSLLDSGNDGLDRAVAAIQRLREDYEDWSVSLGETLANAALTGQQLKLASIEIRRAPWKLLHRPSRRELEHELLYEATRTFALAAAELKAASMSVERVLDQYGGEIADDPETINRLRESLLDRLSGYERAQERLLDILFVDAPQ